MSAAGRMHAGFVSGALLYALGQGCALLFQWLLLRQFGLQGYGDVGLAHLGLTTVLFLADLGYASLFLREDPAAPGWEMRWRQALRHRLLATLALDLAWLVAAGWSWRGRGEGFGYMLAVLPATLFGLVGYSAPLLAQGRRLQGFAVQQIAMPVTLALWVPLRHLPEWGGGIGAGLAVSIGYLVQAVVNAVVFAAPLRLLWPQRGQGRSLLGTAVQLSLLGIVGTLHDRLTPLLLAAVAPAFLPVYLFLGYLINGASGVFNQFNRLLLAEATSEAGQRWAQWLISLVLGGAALGALALPLAAEAWGSAMQRAWLPLTTPVLAGGAVALLSGVLAALLIGRHRERALLRLLLAGLLCSTLLQLAAAAGSAPQALLWGRLVCLLGIAAASLHLCGLRLNGGGGAALLAALLAASPWFGRIGWTLAAALLLPALWIAWRRHGLFAPVAERVE
ncbi:MAG: hypothetical protein ABW002_01300 [Xanthomonas sp.]